MAIVFKRPEDRVRKLGRNFYIVEDLERPGRFLCGPSFKRFKDAVGYAKENEQAVRERLGVVQK